MSASEEPSMRLAVLEVEGVELDGWTTAPLFRTDGDGRQLRLPGVELVDDLGTADAGVLPGVWSAYQGSARYEAMCCFDEAEELGRPVVVWVDGDQEVDLRHPAAVLFEQGPEGHRDRSVRVHAWPVLIHDHLADHFDGDVAPVPRGDAPTVAFCGQAAAPWTGHVRLLLGKARQRVQHRTRRTDRLPAPWPSHLRLRRRALDVLVADPRVTTDFVVRNRYRAGVTSLAERADRTSPTATEFFTNIRGSAYTVCVRGGGNFSTRLYETLCLGRIPVLVDTGLVLPWAGEVPWDDIAVIVPAGRLDQLADRVVAHHAGFDDEGFLAHQRRCRDLWVDRLSTPGYLRHLPELLARL